MGDLVVAGGTVVTSAGRMKADVLCRDERIAQIGADLSADAEVVDATDSFVLPGVVDPHLHFALVAEPHRTADDFDSGSASALAGGVTTFIDFAHQHRGEGFEEAIDRRLGEAVSSRCDYSLHLIVTDISGGQLEEVGHLTKRGFASAKVYTTYKAAGFHCDDYTILRFMRKAAEQNWLVMVHCENDDIVEGTRSHYLDEGKRSFRFHGLSRPVVAEVETVGRVITFSKNTGCTLYPVHLSAGESARLVARARKDGLPVIGETCPHFLVADESVYGTERANRFIHTPPLRSRRDVEVLWEELGGDGLQTVASDHCGYTLAQRTDFDDITRVAPGIPGTETILPLLYTYGVARGRLSLEQLVKICSENAARTFGMYPRKGTIAEGSDADIVVYDPQPSGTLADEGTHSAAGYTPYAGMEITGRVRATVHRGRLAFDGADVLVAAGNGSFVARSPVSPQNVP
jgi:dihydropyrimidinase